MRRNGRTWVLVIGVAFAAACGARTPLLELAERDAGSDAAFGGIGGESGSGSGGDSGSGGVSASGGAGGDGGSGGAPGPCLPGEGPVELASGYVWPNGIAILGEFVFFTLYDEAGAVMRVPKAGGQVVTLIDGLDYASDVAADATGVYAAASNDGQILRTDASGSVLELLSSGESGPTDIAIDGTHVYWTNYVGRQIRRVAKSGGAAMTLTMTDSSPYRMGLGAERVYWGQQVDGVWMVDKEGGDSTSVGDDFPRSFATDDTWLYYTTGQDGGVNRMPLGGGDIEELFSYDGFSDGIAVDGTHIYVTYVGGDIIRIPKEGGTAEGIAAEQAGPTHIVTDDQCVYWTNTGDGLPSIGSVMRASKQLQ